MCFIPLTCNHLYFLPSLRSPTHSLSLSVDTPLFHSSRSLLAVISPNSAVLQPAVKVFFSSLCRRSNIKSTPISPGRVSHTFICCLIPLKQLQLGGRRDEEHSGSSAKARHFYFFSVMLINILYITFASFLLFNPSSCLLFLL